MPSALYAISYKLTSSLIALCRFEKKTLIDQASRDQLLAALVGNRLPISMFTSSPAVEIAIAASELGCDLVNDLSPQDLEPVIAEPYRYRVATDPGGPTLPGDGTPKLLKRIDNNAVRSITLSLGHPAQVTVHLANPPGGAIARLVFEGRESRANEPPPKTGEPSPDLVFQLPVGVEIAANKSYGVVFLMEDTPVEMRRVTAPPPPPPPPPGLIAPGLVVPPAPRANT